MDLRSKLERYKREQRRLAAGEAENPINTETVRTSLYTESGTVDRTNAEPGSYAAIADKGAITTASTAAFNIASTVSPASANEKEAAECDVIIEKFDSNFLYGGFSAGELQDIDCELLSLLSGNTGKKNRGNAAAFPSSTLSASSSTLSPSSSTLSASSSTLSPSSSTLPPSSSTLPPSSSTLPSSSSSSASSKSPSSVQGGDLLFLDTETTGLSGGAGTVAFLIGIGYFDDGGFVVKQFLMRDYDEELSMLRQLEIEMSARHTLVTYNGKAFDVNLLEGRFIMNARRMPVPQNHIDLLYIARRIWRNTLENCRLATIESSVLKAEREDDIPGAMIPELYFRYLQSRDSRLLSGILHHNRFDVMAMAGILKYVSESVKTSDRGLLPTGRQLPGGVPKPKHGELFGGGNLLESVGEGGVPKPEYGELFGGGNLLESAGESGVPKPEHSELFGFGNLLESLGEYERAKYFYLQCAEARENCGPRAFRMALSRLAMIFWRTGEYECAAKYWKMLIELVPRVGPSPYIELAKYYEHKVGDPATAIEYVEGAWNIALKFPNIEIWNKRLIDGIELRRQRLRKKISKITK